MPKVKVGDINMYYEVHGKGEPLVMINVASGNTGYYYRVIKAPIPGYKLVIFDNRGAGKTDAPAPPYSTAMMADDLAGLLDNTGIDSAHIMGTSLGGMIAQEFALRYPKKVKSLFLASTYCGSWSTIASPETMEAMQSMASLPPKEMMMATLRVSMSQEFCDKNPGLLDEIAEHMLQEPLQPQGMMGQMSAAIGHNTCEGLPEIKAPTLVIAGEADRVVPAENSRILAAGIPGAELVILKGKGHMFWFEAESETNRIMLDFLRRHSTKKA